MLHQISTYYYIFTFKRDEYEKLKKNIRNKRIYTHYIDTKNNEGKVNIAYEKYLSYKNYIYTKNIPKEDDSIFSTILCNLSDADLDKINILEKKVNPDKQYYLDKEIKYDDDIKTVIKTVNAVESLIMDRSIDMDNSLEKQERRDFKKNFISNKKQRYFLIPFLGEINSNMIEPMVILTLYDVGILTFEIVIGSKENNLKSIENDYSYMNFEKLIFYEQFEKYDMESYFEQNELKSTKETQLDMGNVIDYYKQMIEKATEVKLYNEEDFFQKSNVIGIFNEDSQGNGIDSFVSENLNKLYQFSTNADQDLIRVTPKKQMEKVLADKTATRNKSHLFIINTSHSVLLLNDFIMDKRIKEQFKDDDIEKDLKEEKLYNEYLYDYKVEWLYSTYHEMLKYYEINLIRKFYSKKLLSEINNSKTLDRKKLSKLISELDFLLLSFDEETLFRYDGSVKDLYRISLELSGANNLFEKTKNIIQNLEQNIKNEEEIKNEKFKDKILFLSTVLSVFLSFSGIESIITSLMKNKELKSMLDDTPCSPLSITFILWIIVCFYIVSVFKREETNIKD